MFIQNDKTLITMTVFPPQLSWGSHIAICSARWPDGTPHRWLPGWSVHGALPRAAGSQDTDPLSGHNVSSPLTKLLFGAALCVAHFWFIASTEMGYRVEIKNKIKLFFFLHRYCSPEYTFPTQQEVITFAVNTAFEQITLNPRTLVVCGTYAVGKEKVFLGQWAMLSCFVQTSCRPCATSSALERVDCSLFYYPWPSYSLVNEARIK